MFENNAKVALETGRQFVEEAKEALENFFGANPIHHIVRGQGGSGYSIYRFDQPMPSILVGKIAAALQYYRSALDLMTTELITTFNPKIPGHKPQFPIGKNNGEYENACNKYLKNVQQTWIHDLYSNFEAYLKDSNDTEIPRGEILYHLNQMAKEDRHRKLIVTNCKANVNQAIYNSDGSPRVLQINCTYSHKGGD